MSGTAELQDRRAASGWKGRLLLSTAGALLATWGGEAAAQGTEIYPWDANPEV